MLDFLIYLDLDRWQSIKIYFEFVGNMKRTKKFSIMLFMSEDFFLKLKHNDINRIYIKSFMKYESICIT